MSRNEYDPRLGDTIAGTAMSIARASLFRVVGNDPGRFSHICALHATLMSGMALTRENSSVSPYDELELKDALRTSAERVRQHLSDSDTEMAIYMSRIVAAEVARQVILSKKRSTDAVVSDPDGFISEEVA